MTDIPTLTHHAHMLDKRLAKVEELAQRFVELHDRYEQTRALNAGLGAKLIDAQAVVDRFAEIEKFMAHMLSYFDPTPKMKAELTRLRGQIHKKDSELAKIKDNLKGILK